MKCVRCGNIFDSSSVEMEAERYGGDEEYACPHCGKLYIFRRIVEITIVPDENIDHPLDSRGNLIVKDSEYKLL